MLGRSLLKQTLRPQRFAFTQSSELLNSTRRFDYTNPRVRNKKHKAAAKERRRIVRARKADVNKSPHDMGEELPPFMIPPRYKLIFKYL